MHIRGSTYVPRPEVADSATLHLAVLDRVFHGLPARQPGLGSAVRRVQQEQVDVTKPTRINALLDAPPDCRIRLAVAGELGRVEDMLTVEMRSFSY